MPKERWMYDRVIYGQRQQIAGALVLVASSLLESRTSSQAESDSWDAPMGTESIARGSYMGPRNPGANRKGLRYE